MSGQIGGDFGPITIPDKAQVEVGQFTVERAGEYQMTVELTEIVKNPDFPAISLVQIDVHIDGERYLLSQQDAEFVTVSVDLTVGQEVTIDLAAPALSVTVSGTWLVESDALITLPPNAFFPDQIECVHWGITKAQALYYGSILIWQDEDEPTEPTEPQHWNLTTQGAHTIEIPVWAAVVDIVCIGGGGGGGNGGGAAANAGEGGKAGTFGTASLEVQGLSSMRLSAEVGGGGVRGSGGGARGGSGGNSRVVYAGTSNRVGNAGQGGAGGRGALGDGSLTAGRAAGSITYEGVRYVGGSGGRYADNSTGGTGSAPGGGGGGGAGGIFSAFWNGGAGGTGAIWITAWSRRALDR